MAHDDRIAQIDRRIILADEMVEMWKAKRDAWIQEYADLQSTGKCAEQAMAAYCAALQKIQKLYETRYQVIEERLLIMTCFD